MKSINQIRLEEEDLEDDLDEDPDDDSSESAAEEVRREISRKMCSTLPGRILHHAIWVMSFVVVLAWYSLILSPMLLFFYWISTLGPR